MAIAALIISVLALIMSTACASLLIGQRLSTHKMEIFDPAAIEEMNKQDKKINEKIKEIEQDDEWI